MRSFDDYRVVPTEEEAKADGCPADKRKGPWERLIGPAIVNKGEGWGSKGNWILALGIMQHLTNMIG